MEILVLSPHQIQTYDLKMVLHAYVVCNYPNKKVHIPQSSSTRAILEVAFDDTVELETLFPVMKGEMYSPFDKEMAEKIFRFYYLMKPQIHTMVVVRSYAVGVILAKLAGKEIQTPLVTDPYVIQIMVDTFEESVGKAL